MLDWLLKQAGSFVVGEVKHQAREALRGKQKEMSLASAVQEAEDLLGYKTEHVSIKGNKIHFKSSPLFCLEWIMNSKYTKDLYRDEESNDLYFDSKVLSEQEKLELINKFAGITKIDSPSLIAHFNKALDLIAPVDMTSRNFEKLIGPWDKKVRITSFMSNSFSDKIDNPKYADILFAKWAVGTANRIMKPGHSFDGCLTLQGGPGIGKTRFFRNLLPEPFEKRTGEIICKDIRQPDKFVESIIGKSIANFDELSILNDNVVETFKMLLSGQGIDVRMPWARKKSRYLYRQGFSATTNPEKFITDPALSRRLWVIQIKDGRLDFDYLEKNKRQMWAEAIVYAKQGFSDYLSPKEQDIVEKNNTKFLI